jgi:hypothetical protein
MKTHSASAYARTRLPITHTMAYQMNWTAAPPARALYFWSQIVLSTALTYLRTYRLSHQLSIPIMSRLCRILTH